MSASSLGDLVINLDVTNTPFFLALQLHGQSEPLLLKTGVLVSCTQDSGEYLAKLPVVGTGRWGAAGLVVFLCTVVGSLEVFSMLLLRSLAVLRCFHTNDSFFESFSKPGCLLQLHQNDCCSPLATLLHSKQHIVELSD